jgi:hypothetical protein
MTYRTVKLGAPGIETTAPGFGSAKRPRRIRQAVTAAQTWAEPGGQALETILSLAAAGTAGEHGMRGQLR